MSTLNESVEATTITISPTEVTNPTVKVANNHKQVSIKPLAPEVTPTKLNLSKNKNTGLSNPVTLEVTAYINAKATVTSFTPKIVSEPNKINTLKIQVSCESTYPKQYSTKPTTGDPYSLKSYTFNIVINNIPYKATNIETAIVIEIPNQITSIDNYVGKEPKTRETSEETETVVQPPITEEDNK